MVGSQTDKNFINLKKQLIEFSDFGNKTVITKASLIIIKLFFHLIICEYGAEHAKAWQMLLQKFDIHHYLCSHTFNAVKKKCKLYAETMDVRYREAKMIQSGEKAYKFGYTDKMATEMFSVVAMNNFIHRCMLAITNGLLKNRKFFLFFLSNNLYKIFLL